MRKCIDKARGSTSLPSGVAYGTLQTSRGHLFLHWRERLGFVLLLAGLHHTRESAVTGVDLSSANDWNTFSSATVDQSQPPKSFLHALLGASHLPNLTPCIFALQMASSNLFGLTVERN